ncbi:NAD(P)H-binding protein [Ralstonia solanacearum]
MQPPAQGRHGDYDRAETLVEAYRGLDRLLLIPSADLRPGVRGRQFTAAIDAAVRAGVPHIVMVSAAGTREMAEPSLGAAYWVGEQHLVRTAARWTILRMNYYAESFAQQVPLSLGPGCCRGSVRTASPLFRGMTWPPQRRAFCLGKGMPVRSTTRPGPWR